MRLHWHPGPLTLQIAPGERLLDVLDEQSKSTLPTACRAANCGTCRVRVLSGANLIQAPDDWELSVLERHAAAPEERLGCQLCFANDTSDGEVRIERAP
jgi:adenylate cyclase